MKTSQINSNVSAFKVPMAPQPQHSIAESLLFNDIIEEKTIALRNTLTEYLQVLPYRNFNTDFDNFLKNANKRIQEVRRAGTNNSRLINSTQTASIYSRPSSSFNCRPGMSMINSHRNSTLRLPENNFQPIESSNPFKPPGNFSFQPRVILPRLNNSGFISHESSVCATVIEVSQAPNGVARTNSINNLNNVQQSIPEERSQSPMPNLYSDVTMDENMAVDDPQQIEDVANDASNSIESLLEDVGFKIVVGLPNNSKACQKSNASKSYENQLNKIKCDEKILSMWSVNIKLIKLNTTKAVLILSGTLLNNDRVTVIEKNHDAGIIESRKEFNLIKTKNGLYRLIGDIVGRSSPKELYEACLAVNGIPRTWKSIMMKHVSDEEKNSKKAMLNFSLDSPAGPHHVPIKPKKSAMKLDISMTRKGTLYGHNMSSQTNNKRKYSEYNSVENSKQKMHLMHDNLPSSTPKRPKKTHTMFETPSQILKNKLVKNINNIANSRLGTINDSINVTKKRHSHSKEQTIAFSKPKTPEKSSLVNNNTTKCSTQTSVNSTSASKSVNSATGSKSKTSENMYHLNSTKEPSKLKSTINSTKSTVNSVEKSVSVKQKRKKQNTSNRKSLTKNVSNKENNKSAKKNQISSKDLSNAVVSKNVLKIDKNMSKQETKNKLVQQFKSSLKKQGQGLFDDEEEEACNSNDDFNLMASPGKLSVISRTDKSRSETPPLFGQQWSSTAKSLVASEPPTPLSKSDDAKALKRRVKAPKITLEEELKNNKKSNKKQSIDYKTASEKINNMLQFGEQYGSDDD